MATILLATDEEEVSRLRMGARCRAVLELVENRSSGVVAALNRVATTNPNI